MESVDFCTGCATPIYDQFLAQLQGGLLWHLDCLQCSDCNGKLSEAPSCYFKENQTYCKQCYVKNFGVKCTRCRRIIQPQDWVRRARNFVYHLACFACDTCKRQLSTGEQFALQDSKLLCKSHYMELIEGENYKENSKRKSKRVRTTFTEEQLQILQANFHIDSNPDGQDLERIAQVTGLSKRVTQVWFQNSRARQKKHHTDQKCSSQSEEPPPNSIEYSEESPTSTQDPIFASSAEDSRIFSPEDSRVPQFSSEDSAIPQFDANLFANFEEFGLFASQTASVAESPGQACVNSVVMTFEHH